MSAGVHVNSIQTLEELCLVLSMFASDCREHLERSEAEIERKAELLEERCRARAREVERWQEAYDCADEDDDLDGISYHLREAEEDYQNARQWLRKVEECAGEYARRAVRMKEISDHRITEACAFLRQKISELKDYVAAQPGNNFTGGVVSAGAPLSPVSEKTSETAVNLTDFTLPKGFSWVKVNNINPNEINALPTKDDYGKVSYEVMKSGLELLKNEVLPAVKELGEKADSDYFNQLDIEKGRETQNGARRVFNAFFGRTTPEHIRLERFAGDPHYDITNGRHRIKLALDLGWDAVPAEVIEVKRQP